MANRDVTIEVLKEHGLSLINDVKKYIHYIEKLQLTNEQYFLDTLDELNQLSVKY